MDSEIAWYTGVAMVGASVVVVGLAWLFRWFLDTVSEPDGTRALAIAVGTTVGVCTVTWAAAYLMGRVFGW